MNNQQTMLYQGVLIPRPVLNVDCMSSLILPGG